MNKTSISLILAFLITNIAFAQDIKNMSLSGYVSNMESTMFEDINNDWISDNLIHNRLNFNWYPINWLTIDIEMRNRIMWGNTFLIYPDYPQMIDTDNGFFDLTTNVFSGKSYLLNSTIDRAYIEINKGKWNLKAGRQRINWGQNFVWNPNDIFNSYSFFDFDYAERPGADALRVQYYTSMSSLAEIAIKANHNNDITAAGLYRFNKWNYDFQFLSGLLNSSDYVAGMGWTGSIKDAGFSGELSYFKPLKENDENKEILVAGLGANYTFENSLMLQLEVLYSEDADQDVGALMEYYSNELSAKTLSFSEYSIMAQSSYTFNPLLSGTMAVMYYPGVDGYFAGPSLEYSLSNNLYLSVFGQYFDVTVNSIHTKMSFLFLRIKGNF
ncbi:MAG: hypothetical protein U9R19_03245 [Bacteroidota bacterium]|nr:hypothetical protein [Bacteroidota bacterium]